MTSTSRRRAEGIGVNRHVDNESRSGVRLTGEVALWRRSLLRQAGFAAGVARDLAANPAYDLHELLNLVDRGCPPQLAARILAPL
jgi:hypothetical protein